MHVLAVRASDPEGNVSTRTVTVAVHNDVDAPQVALLFPVPGVRLAGEITVRVSASDASGVERVELYADGDLLGTDHSEPYAFVWDTADLSNSSHTLMAKAFDSEGNPAVHVITVELKNPVELGPEGLVFDKPVVVRLSLPGCDDTPAALYYWNPGSSSWQKVPGSYLDPETCELVAELRHFSTYAAFFLPRSSTADIGDVYVFPNPATSGQQPTFHVEAKKLDRIDLRVYDVAGVLVHERSLTGSPQVVTRGDRTAAAYEYRWDPGSQGSGVYIYMLEAHGIEGSVRRTGKFAVVR